MPVTNLPDPLFQTAKLGSLTLPNRVLMSPLTRARSSQPGDIPNETNAEYYQQRASAGLIISEASQVSPQGKGFAFTPGIYTDAQVEGWRKVTTAVHQAGGRIYLQLWHVGRISHPDLQENGEQPVGPSAIRPEGAMTYVNDEIGMVEIPEPRALATDEIPGIVEQFRRGAERAKEAGFDGVEVHAANGYLVDQFLKSGSNQRTDEFGGSVENRLRLPLMIIEAVIGVWGKENVGVRVSPTNTFNGVFDENPEETFGEFAKALSHLGIAFIEVVEDFFMTGGNEEGRPEALIDKIRKNFEGTYIANGSYDAKEARSRISAGKCDMVSFGRMFIANPDLPYRFENNEALNELEESTLYGGNEQGYTDYPAIER